MPVAFAVKGLTSFAKDCIELGSNLTEVQNVVDVVFPTMNKKVNEFAQNAASTFGLSETMAKKLPEHSERWQMLLDFLKKNRTR